MVRSLFALAALAPGALALNSRLVALESESAELRMELAVQMRQYAMHLSHEERTEETAQKPSALLARGYASRLGASASLTEAGYSSVAGLHSHEAMVAYASKLLAEDGLELKDAGMLQRVMPFYSGECATQSLIALRKELHEAAAPHGCHAAWVGHKAISAISTTANSTNAEVIELNFTKANVAKVNSTDVNSTEASSMKKTLSLLAENTSVAFHQLHGDEAPLNQAGYLAVVALKSNDEMKKFIRRTSRARGLQIMSEGGLSGFARYYSGVCASQSFAALVKELKSVQHALRTTSVSYNVPASEAVDEHKIKKRIVASTGLKESQIQVTFGTSRLPNVTQVKQFVASKSGVEEDRVTVTQTGGKVAHYEVEEEPEHEVQHVSLISSEKPVKVAAHQHEVKKASAHKAHKHGASHAPALKHGVSAHKPHTAKAGAVHAHSSKAVRSFIVTVTSGIHDPPVEDILKSLTRKMEVKVNGVPATMVASVAQSKRCGGGWIAPKVKAV
eukprot:TRINITY_DN75_c0_g2_i1.p1 TRINITY_DN75_c0_g2~~TRINITY_DN75_c0_g2_i1.p1  ORF type:complete len:540 (-),score=113.27 TRINITY_DN75_c0_g2_i1:159-1670(-)